MENIEDNGLMHISVRLVVYPEQAAPHNHILFIDKVASHLSRNWDVAIADFDSKEYNYIWDFCSKTLPDLMAYDALPVGIKVKLAIM